VSGAVLLAQTATVPVEGVIRDDAGKAITGIKVVIKTVETPQTPAAVKAREPVDAAGRFVTELAPGEYTLTTQPPLCGVAPIALRVQDPAKREITLSLQKKPGEAGEAPGVGTKTTTQIGAALNLGVLNLNASRAYETMPGGHLLDTGVCDPRLLKTGQAKPAEPKKLEEKNP
jgi:hypothetical protein